MKLLQIILIFFSISCYSQNEESEASKLGFDRLSKIKQTDCYISKKGNLYGLTDNEFKTLFSPQFIYYELYSGDDRFISFKSPDDSYTLFDMAKKEVLQKNKSWIMFYRLVSKDLDNSFFIVRNKDSNDHLLYNDKNEMVKNLGNYDISLQGKNNFGTFVLGNSTDKNFILINENGTEICSYPYVFQPYTDKDYFLVSKNFPQNSKYGIINHFGKVIKELKFDKIFFKENIIVFNLKNSYLITDLFFNSRHEIPVAKEIDFITNEYILVKISDTKWKLITEYGKEKFQIIAKKVEYHSRNSLKVTTDKEDYFIDFNGVKFNK